MSENEWKEREKLELLLKALCEGGGIGDEGGRKIGEALTVNSTLTLLNLYGEFLFDMRLNTKRMEN